MRTPSPSPSPSSYETTVEPGSHPSAAPPTPPVRVPAVPPASRLISSSLSAPTGRLLVRRRGADLLGDALLNKDTAFPEVERDAFGLRGLLPSHVTSIEEQVALELEHVRRKDDDLEQYIGLAALQDRNETLFYRLLVENLEEFMPVVYTPTVGRACQQFSHIFRRPRGIWITPTDLDRIADILRDAGEDIRLLVVTDNERILGLGDQGAGGMPIPVGKLALYSAGAGIYPARTLPVSLDVGTDNEVLLADPLYLGYRARRLRGEAYDTVLEAFVEAVGDVFPRAVVQWEDFKQHNAMRILARYRHRLASFNDDVQGTAAVVLAGLLAARRDDGGLAGERILFVGAGAAALGIAELVRQHLVTTGLDDDAARESILMLDSAGLVHADRAGLDDDKRAFACRPARLARLGLDVGRLADPVAVSQAFRPTALVGTTGGVGTFSEALVRSLDTSERPPIVLALSNPSSRTEAQPADVLRWTRGRALVATGSPFAPVTVDRAIRVVGQANNALVFPGVGLGAMVAEARELTDELFLTAADELASMVTAERLATGAIYPPVDQLRAISRAIAVAIVRSARDSGHGRQYRDEEIEPAVDRATWWPSYLPFEPA